MVSAYVPSRGDVVWLDFDPQAGHEQAGRRPALVLSQQRYNRATGLGLFCPITSKIKGYPFEVPIHGEVRVDGVILADQVRNLDWRRRRAELIETAPAEVVDDVVERFSTLMFD